MTYSLKDSASGNDAQPLYSAWMSSFNAATRTITYVTSDMANKGVYDVTIKAVLNDSMATTATTTFKFYLVALVLSPCSLSDLYYVIQTSTYDLNTDFAAFTYTTDPVVSLPSSYTFSYTITAVLTSGGTPADPLWADFSTSVSRRITIATTTSSDAGSYDFVLKGTLNDSLNSST